ncbi:hypothetical protein LguiA_028808 [Lonicera macranthoides]
MRVYAHTYILVNRQTSAATRSSLGGAFRLLLLSEVVLFSTSTTINVHKKRVQDEIWNNVAFIDNGVSEFSLTLQSSSWCSKDPISDSLDSTSSKENHTLVSLKLLDPNGAIGNLQIKPIKAIPKQGLVEKSIMKSSNKEFVLTKINSEIEETEKEIKRLFCRLEALRLEKV